MKALNQHQFGEALGLLRQAFPATQSTNPLKDVNDRLRQILVWHLTEHTVPELITQAYSNIEFAKVKQMLGDPSNINQIVQSTGLLASSNPDAQGFVEVSSRHASHEPFALNQDRVEKLTQVVQFLER